MKKAKRKRAPTPNYISPNQLTLETFASPFAQRLKQDNRWVVLGNLIPWDEVCGTYLKHVGISRTGRPALSPRVVIGSLIIKHILNLDDRETVDQISENMYMQYFLGYTSFSSEPPFDPSLFVEFRKRLGMEQVNQINERIVALRNKAGSAGPEDKPGNGGENTSGTGEGRPQNHGKAIFDATACPQDIAYPTDLDLLSTSREKSEELIGLLYDKALHGKKPRTYRYVARKAYLKTA